MKYSLICVAACVAVAATSIALADIVDVQPSDAYTTVLSAAVWRPAQKTYTLTNTSYDWVYWQGSSTPGKVVCSPASGWIAPSAARTMTITPAAAMASAIPGTYAEQVTVDFQPRLVGDVNGDATVDVIDVLILSQSWGSRSGQAGYNPVCDFNGDGSIDVLDMLNLAANFGRTFGGMLA